MTGGIPSTSDVDLTCQDFVLWGLAALKIPAEPLAEHTYRVHFPPHLRPSLIHGESLDVTFGPGGEAAARVAADSPLLDWLAAQLRRLGPAIHAAPADQPVSVHQISPHLFRYYQVEQGTMRLSGCQLVDQAILRLSYRVRGEDESRIVHCYSLAGQPLDEELIEALGVEQLAAPTRVGRFAEPELQRWVAESQLTLGVPSDAELLVVTAVWCKYLSATLNFTVGSHSVDWPVTGWAKLFSDGRLEPPPYVCPWTRRRSYRLAATDDGRVTVAEALAYCEESGARVLDTELQTCEATGKRVLPQYLARCPVTLQRVVQSALLTCPLCQQQVSPAACEPEQPCSACQELKPVRKDDPRMARVLGEFPRLDRWRRWALSETHVAYVLMARALMHQLLVVLDKDNLQPLYVAKASRLARHWAQVPEEQQYELFGR